MYRVFCKSFLSVTTSQLYNHLVRKVTAASVNMSFMSSVKNSYTKNWPCLACFVHSMLLHNRNSYSMGMNGGTDRWLKWFIGTNEEHQSLSSHETAGESPADCCEGWEQIAHHLFNMSFLPKFTWLTVWPVTLKVVTGVLSKTRLLSPYVV